MDIARAGGTPAWHAVRPPAPDGWAAHPGAGRRHAADPAAVAAPRRAARLDRWDGPAGVGTDDVVPATLGTGDLGAVAGPGGPAAGAPALRFTVNPGAAEASALSLPEVTDAVHAAVAARLGTGTDDVDAAIRDGRSLDDLADVTGTSRDDLLAAVQQALPGSLGTSTVGRALAQRIAGTAGPLTDRTLDLPVTAGGPAATRTVSLTLDATAATLGLSHHDLTAQLAAGTSLDDLADARGVDHADLRAAVGADLSADAPAGLPGWSDPEALVTQVTAARYPAADLGPLPRGGGVPGPPAPFGEPVQRFTVSPDLAEVPGIDLPDLQRAVTTAVAARLGTGTVDLASAAASGYTLADMADITGTSRDDLLATVQRQLPGSLASSTAGRAIAERIAATAGPITQQTLDLPITTPGLDTRAVTVTLSGTAGLLGMGAADLTATLAAGGSLGELADARGIGRDDLLAAVRADLPPDTPGWTDPDALAAQLAGTTTSSTVRQPVQQFTVRPDLAQAAALDLSDLQSAVERAAADRLGTGVADLQAAASAGYTLDDLADVTGTSRDDLSAAVQQALPGDLRTSALGHELARRITATAGPFTPQLLDLPATIPGTDQTVTVTLGTTADLLGIGERDLPAQLSGGRSLDDLADARGVSHDDLRAAVRADLPADAAGWDDPDALADRIAARAAPVTAPGSARERVDRATTAYTAPWS